MPYIGNSDANAAAYARERDLLLSGLSYLEISEKTGQRQRTVSERNRLIHKVNIWDAFAVRCEREGIPSRMPQDAAFCSWFTGFFDGEGCIVAMTRPCTGRAQYSEFRLQVRIQIREDDAGTIDYIIQNIACGRTAKHKSGNTVNSRPSVSWYCETINDLAEVIVPLFDTFQLHTKKAREYVIWRPLVIRRYMDTLGGRSNRKGVKAEYYTAFKDAMQAIHDIRHGIGVR